MDPLVADRTHSLDTYNGFTWHDPIVVNETAGWLSLVDNSVLYPQRGEGLEHSEGLEHTDGSSMILASNSKNPRKRPKKKTKMRSNQNFCETRSPPVQKSCLEAVNTWNTAKLIGISSTEERLVLSGLRKSKRLMIMDGVTD